MEREREREREREMSQKAAAEMLARGLSSLAKYAAVLGIGGSAVAASLYNVDGGERAVIFDRFRGVLPVASDEGTHFLVPWVQTAHIMDVKIRPRLIPSATGTKDLQMVRLILTTEASFIHSFIYSFIRWFVREGGTEPAACCAPPARALCASSRVTCADLFSPFVVLCVLFEL